MAELFTLPKQVPIQSSGAPWAGAKAYFYRAGTTTDQSVYTDAACSVAHAQPVVADANGVFAPIYKNPAASYDYRLQLKQSDGTLIYDVDDVPRFTLTQAQIGQLFYPRTAAEIAAGVTPTNYAYPPGDVRRYGAVGDGVTDDGAAIQTAINVMAVGGGVVYLPASVYIFASPITLAKNVIYRGDGKSIDVAKSTVLKYTGSSDALVDLQAINSSTQVNMRFEHMAFYYVTATVSALKGMFHLRGSTGVDFDDCGIYGGEYGIIADQAELVTVDRCDFENQTTGSMWLVNGAEKSATASELFTNRISVRRSQFNSDGTAAIIDDGGVSHVFEDNNFNGYASHIRLCGVEGCTIAGNEMEVSTASMIVTAATKFGGAAPALTKCRGLNISANFMLQTTGDACVHLASASVASAQILGNALSTTSGVAPVYGAENADKIFLSGNVQRGGGLAVSYDCGYMEGSWTPAPQVGGADVGVAGTFVGRYTRIGQQVTAHGSVTFTNKGSSVGAMKIAGLPFQAGGIGTFPAGVGYAANLASAYQLQPWVQQNESDLTMQKGNLATTVNMTDADVTDTTRIDFAVTYTVN
jgi:hypothetical protein